jgi:hypothetical protein
LKKFERPNFWPKPDINIAISPLSYNSFPTGKSNLIFSTAAELGCQRAWPFCFPPAAIGKSPPTRTRQKTQTL